MKRLAVLVLFAFLVGGSSLIAAPRVTSVEPPMASPGGSLAVLGTNLNEVEFLFLTVGVTDVEVQITGKTAEEIRFKLPADIAHGRYSLMLQTRDADDEPVLLVLPLTCEVMSAAEVAERKSQMDKEQQRIDSVAPSAEGQETPPTK